MSLTTINQIFEKTNFENLNLYSYDSSLKKCILKEDDILYILQMYYFELRYYLKYDTTNQTNPSKKVFFEKFLCLKKKSSSKISKFKSILSYLR